MVLALVFGGDDGPGVGGNDDPCSDDGDDGPSGGPGGGDGRVR